MTHEELLKTAIEARENAYVPYSHFAVGAALLAKSGKVYRGCNVENAAYGPTNCAERTAFFTAVCAGEREFEALAICGGPAGKPVSELCAPCGVCRQVIREFCPDDFPIVLTTDGTKLYETTLAELLPLSFSADDLNK
ncbi:MAG: cytidine deaminase [Candidatus Faecousia sp.]|jgi:cytidine deaminase|uniref:cytidine deaminase n=1 Tax=Faecousia sp. TaxID=2952921 RepID=UPI002A8BF767|nr:cytidine deaminase [Candidatus Faecousia sp.]